MVIIGGRHVRILNSNRIDRKPSITFVVFLLERQIAESEVATFPFSAPMPKEMGNGSVDTLAQTVVIYPHLENRRGRFSFSYRGAGSGINVFLHSCNVFAVAGRRRAAHVDGHLQRRANA